MAIPVFSIAILKKSSSKYFSYLSAQIEGIPTIVMAFLLLLFLPSFPFTSTFLSPREKAIAQARLDRDHKPSSHGGMNGWQGLRAVLMDINSWLLMLVYVGCRSCTTVLGLFTLPDVGHPSSCTSVVEVF